MHTYPDTLFKEIEFDLVREQVASYAATPWAQKKLLDLHPGYSFKQVQVALAEVNEILGLYQNGTSVPALSAATVDEILHRLRVKNNMLEAPEFLQIKDLVDSYNHVHLFFGKQKDFAPTVQLHFADCPQNPEIPKEIDRVLDRKGEVKSDASKELWEIRHSLQKKRAAADRIFYKVAKRYDEAGLLGQFAESVHEDRRVLAVNASFKAQAKGIFHGSSSKSSLIFIEPLETIEINNEITLLLDDERREIMRILRNLTAFMAGHRGHLQDMAIVLRKIDFIHAKARYAYRENACLPHLSKKPELHLVQAINPILRHFNKIRQKSVVPLDVALHEEQRILVISGPNAGGKSLTLKTVGLLQTMLQSGLLVPVHPRSTFGWFGSMMADIGDAQSIENELSTYSSKLAKTKIILEEAQHDSLVLIDEFGSGSDPDLGSALAQVFLEELNNAKAFGVLTTHYNAIKALAGNLPGVANASMQFDSQNFNPEYVLNVGTPGSSYTFEVAQRVGISARLIKQSRQKLDQKTVAIDQLLVAVQTEKNALTEARETMQTRLRELSALKDKQTGKIAQLEEKLEKQRAASISQADTLTWGKKLESLAQSYLKENSAKKKKEIIGRFIMLTGEKAGIVDAQNQKEATKESKRKEAKLQKLLAHPIVVGDKVKLIATNQRGVVLEIRKEKYLISLGMNMSTWAERSKFVPDIPKPKTE